VDQYVHRSWQGIYFYGSIDDARCHTIDTHADPASINIRIEWCLDGTTHFQYSVFFYHLVLDKKGIQDDGNKSSGTLTGLFRNDGHRTL
jgi:hypothetical protein